jgi:hypothetical protein
MRNLARHLCAFFALAALGGCSGIPISLGSPVDGPVPKGTERQISSESCGFQLLLLIPIAVNGRAAQAYHDLEAQAGGDFITDVEVKETWTYGFVGTLYCTQMRAKAIHRAS